MQIRWCSAVFEFVFRLPHSHITSNHKSKHTESKFMWLLVVEGTHLPLQKSVTYFHVYTVYFKMQRLQRMVEWITVNNFILSGL